MAETVADVKAQTLFEELSNIKPKHLARCCMTSSQKMKAETIGDTQNEEETKALL